MDSTFSNICGVKVWVSQIRTIYPLHLRWYSIKTGCVKYSSSSKKNRFPVINMLQSLNDDRSSVLLTERSKGCISV